MLRLIDLSNKKIIVTGASQGIGRDTAIMLSKLGAKIIVVARNEEKLKETISMMDGDGHKYCCLDLSDVISIEECVKSIVKENGAMDGLVYCAGITDDRPLNLLKPDVVANLFNINLQGFIEIVRCLTKKKNFNVGMRIVCVSSVSALIASKAHMAYSASKAGMNGAVRCMALELAPKGIAVNSVAPGLIMTEMVEKFLDNNGGIDGEFAKANLVRQYLGMGKTDDVAATISFLMSPAARFITGVCVPIDGGLTSC